MRLGIDFGTTRIAVAAADRGNYPLVTFEGPDETAWDWFPPIVALRGQERRYGFEAWSVRTEPDWVLVRSIKRLLADASLTQCVRVGDAELAVHETVTELAAALKTALTTASTLVLPGTPAIEVMLGVPANANTNQRFLTADAFQRAGFTVLGMLNEPSAASIELGHTRKAASAARNLVLVYDFGGGTFDASLVAQEGGVHSVIGTAGLETLGGDDFDEILADLALDAADLRPEGLSAAETFWLAEECRRKKEGVHPNSRRVSVDLGSVRSDWAEVSVPVSEFYERCLPLVDRTLALVDNLLHTHGVTVSGAHGRGGSLGVVYVTGAGSELPIVARVLRERYGRLVRRSAHPRGATAIGLAIQADGRSGYTLRDRFTRHFGVWRESNDGTRSAFDVIFPKGTPLPALGEQPLAAQRRYHPAHNIGHFRFLECSELGADDGPSGDVTTWNEIRFGFLPELQDAADLAGLVVERSARAAQHLIEESYSCDATGTVHVRLANVSSNTSRVFQLARWGTRPAGPRQARKRSNTSSRSK
jgi:molecular chaperone DnaK (HSP70)